MPAPLQTPPGPTGCVPTVCLGSSRTDAHVQAPPRLPAATAAQLPWGHVLLNYPALSTPAQNTRTFAVGTAEARGGSPLLCTAHGHFPSTELCYVALTAWGCRGGVVLAKPSRAPSSSQAVPTGHSPVMPRAISSVSISFILALTSLQMCF